MELDGARVSKAELELAGKRCLALMLELPNACILLLSEGRLALGTLAIAMPPGPLTPSSTCVLGQRHSTLVRMLAERLATLKGKIALVSLRAEGPEAEVGARAIALFKEILEEGGRS
ncbi:hypothetical protein DRO33_00250 [Candidatus Bathyarchaeota archaeon]|nr:MAG: hypothetical protein DRO33_00250 [Candidatus Bathyarchaeota archaeon]